MCERRPPFRRRQAALLLRLSVIGALAALPAISQAATTGTISGIVTAAKTDADEQPIIDPATANLVAGAPQSGVQITLAPGGRKTVTDKSGRFTFTGVQPGRYTVRAELVTFDPGEVQVNVSQDLTSTADIILTKIVGQTEGEIEIQVVRPNVTTTTTEVSARREQLTKAQPLNLYQFPGLLLGVPGITPDPTGYPHIRGGDVDQVGFQVDGIDITDVQTNTFGTNIVTVGLKNANIYTGGTTAAYGGKTAGFINEVTQNGRDVRGGIFEYTGGPGYGHDYEGTNIQYGNAFGNDKFDAYGAFIGFRNNFPEDTTVQSLNDSADGLLKINYYAGPSDTLTAFHSAGFASYDLYQPRADFPDARLRYDDRLHRAFARDTYQQDYQPQSSQLTYLTYRHNFNPASFATFRTYRFHTDTRIYLENTSAQYQQRGSTYVGNQLNYENQINRQYRLQLGLEHIQTTGAGSEIVGRLATASGDWTDATTADGTPIFPASGYTHLLDRVKPRDLTAYVDNQFRFLDDRATVDLGLRWSERRFDRFKFEDFSRSYTDPRVGLTLNANRNMVFRGSLYRNSQFPDSSLVEVLFPEDLGFATARIPGDPNLPLTDPANVGSQFARMSRTYTQDNRLDTVKSEGYDIGMEQGLTLRGGPLAGTYQAVLTGYRRRQWDLMQVDLASFAGGLATPPLSYVSQGTGHTSGVEFQLNKRRVRESDLNGFFSYTNQVARTSADKTTTGQLPFFFNFVSDPFLTDEDYRQLNRQEFAPSYDQRHTVALVVNKRVHKNVETTLILDAGSGFPFAGGAPADFGSFGNADSQHGSKIVGDADFTEVPVLLNDRRTIQPQSPVVGRSGWHYKFSINNNFYISRDSWFFFNVDNVFGQKYVLTYATANNAGLIYYNTPTPQYPQGSIFYGKATVQVPTFLAFGIRTRF